MKFRIYGNHLRVRLTRGEVARLGAGQKIVQTTNFSILSKFITSVEPSAQVTVASATFDGDHLAVILPLTQVELWANSTQVGIEANQRIDADQSLRILVEKDFECLHKEDEQTPDAFPNPRL